MIQIVNSTVEDIPVILSFYDIAIAYQKEKSNRHWQSFDPALVAQEISEGRQWKLLADGVVAAVFLTADADREIWGEKDRDDAIYLHRIVTHDDYRGRNLFAEIMNWAKDYARSRQRPYLRMDTWGDNDRLVRYYTDNGFTLQGITTPEDVSKLPSHYSCISLALLEMKL